MSEEELQALSRKAALRLPADWIRPPGAGEATIQCPSGEWCGMSHLYNSTSICAEIMVRVLWNSGADSLEIFGSHLDYGGVQCIVQSRYGERLGKKIFMPLDVIKDPMLAFRVAVLKALVALKKG